MNCLNLRLLIFYSLCLLILASISSQMQAADSREAEIEQIARSLSVSIQGKGLKKIAIVPFSDLRNSPREIGRYVSEMLSVQLGKVQNGFSIHEFISGTNVVTTKSPAEAFIVGTVIPFDEHLQCTVKLIASGSSEILYATTNKIPRNNDINSVLESEGIMNWNQTFADLLRIRKGSEALGGLLINVESLKYSAREGREPRLLLTVTFVNTNKLESLSFAFEADGNRWLDTETHILSNRKDVYRLRDAEGLSRIRYSNNQSPNGWYIDLPPLSSTNATLTYELSEQSGDSSGDFPPYRFQASVYLGKRNDQGVGNIKLHNFVFDLEPSK